MLCASLGIRTATDLEEASLTTGSAQDHMRHTASPATLGRCRLLALHGDAMATRRVILIFATLAAGCGSIRTSNAGEPSVLVDGFPAKPWPNQRQPSPDGRCSQHGPPQVIVVNGGCWVWVEMDLADCEQANKEGEYEVPYQGRCYYPLFKRRSPREPTSSIQSEERTRNIWGGYAPSRNVMSMQRRGKGSRGEPSDTDAQFAQWGLANAFTVPLRAPPRHARKLYVA